MKNKLQCLQALCLLLNGSLAFAQQDSIPPNIPEESILEQLQLPENVPAEFELVQLAEINPKFNTRKLDINTANADELFNSGIFNAFQIDQLIAWRGKTGAFLNLYELQAIPGFTLADIRLVLPHICIGGDAVHQSLQELLKNTATQLSLRTSAVLEKASGYSNGNYLGNRLSHYARYRRQSKQISLSLAVEKDAGEPYIHPPKIRLADFASFHLKFPWKKSVLIIGDFNASFGQGLILMQQFAPGKSPLITQLKRIPKVIKPYTSRGEHIFFRGAAASFPVHQHLTASALLSVRRVDANNLVDSLSESQQFSAFQLSGLHRTKAEIEDKKSLMHLAVAASLQYQHRKLNLGCQFVAHRLDQELQQSAVLYRKYAFSGNALLNTSMNYSYIHQNMNFFGEIGISGNGGLGNISGMLLSLDKSLQFSLLYRYYSRDFQTIFASGIAESSGNRNEKGLYWGLTFTPIRKIKIESFVDFWQNPWLKYQTDAPSRGQEYLCKASFKPNKTTELYVTYRFTQKEKSVLKNPNLTLLETMRSQQLRIHFSKQVNAFIRLQCRAEFSNFQPFSPPGGAMLFADLKWKSAEWPIALNMRYTIFSTDSYDNRIYAFENTFSGNYALSGIYGKGSRSYLNIRYSGIRGISVDARWARTYLANAPTMGTGNEMIAGNKKSEIGIQLNFRI